MTARRRSLLALLAGPAAVLALALRLPAEDAKPKINYKDHVAGIFQSKCNACHNNDKKKGGLALESYTGVMQGGASGAVVEPGDPDNSRLYLLVSHQEEPAMPPQSPKLPDADLETIRAWIEAGAPETSGSAVAVKAKPKMEFKLDPSAVGKPQGPPAMPEDVPTETFLATARPNAILALAASPWAPLVAVAGHKQVLLYNTQTRHLCGVLPFPEGDVYSLRFSRDGGILLGGGGRGAEKGLAVAWDVKTGRRLFEVGKEFDIALAADISPDRSLVALGGPGKLVRVYNTADGELAYECKKHTDWVTAVAFSPDGVLLASGDRNGGLVVWEAATGREFHDLRSHTAMITDLDWRLDSNVLASASEDTNIRLWEMENGGNIKGWGAHGSGAQAVRFAKDGRLVSTGRDRITKLWDQNGGALKQFDALPDIGLRAVLTFDDAHVIAGDWSGEVRLWNVASGQLEGTLSANPPPLSVRLDRAQQAHSAARQAADAAQKELATLQAAAAQQAAAVATAQEAQAAADKAVASANAAVAAAEAAHARKAAAAKAAADLLAHAQNAESLVTALRDAGARVAAESQSAAQSARAVLEATQQGRDRELADKAEAAQVAAAKTAEAIAAQASAAAEATRAAQAASQAAASDLEAATAARDAARKSAAEAAAAAEAARSQVEQATAAKAAADKAVADKMPAVQAAAAQAAALQAEIELLTHEKQLADNAAR